MRNIGQLIDNWRFKPIVLCPKLYDPVVDEAKVCRCGSVALVFCLASRHGAGASALAGGCPSTG